MKQNIFKLFFNYIGKSINARNSVSTPRFQSWIILVAILFQVLMFSIFEILSFYVSISTGIPYTISADNIIIFGMLLSHQLALVFSRNKAQSIAEIKGESKEEEIIEEEIIIDEEIIEEEIIEEPVKKTKIKKESK